MFEANDQISSICYDRPLEVELVIADDNVPGKPLHSVIVSEWDCSLRRKDLQVELDRESLGDSETVNLDEGDDLVSIENPSLNTLNCSFSQEKPTDEGESPEAGLAITDFSKQIFVFSEAGKPIFTRYGSEEDFTSLTGILQALVSSVQSNDGDELFSVTVGKLKFSFLCKSPLILVSVSRQWESVQQLQHQLLCIYFQIIFILTTTTLNNAFQRRQNFDLRGLLGFKEKTTTAKKTFENLIRSQEANPAFLLTAVKCLPLAPQVRDTIGSVIASAAGKHKGLVFVFMIAHEQLITIGRMRKCQLHPADIHLIINLITSNPSFRSLQQQFFEVPVCLPRFEDSRFLFAHISYLQESCPACLLMLNVQRCEEEFKALSTIQEKIVQKLKKGRILEILTEAATGISLSEVALPDLLHFLYKNRSSSQFTCPEFCYPYQSHMEQRRLFTRYSEFHDRMHSSSAAAKILYVTGDCESILGWVTTGFELYAVFSPLTTKVTAVSAVDKLMKWLKKEENRLFITNPPLF